MIHSEGTDALETRAMARSARSHAIALDNLNFAKLHSQPSHPCQPIEYAMAFVPPHELNNLNKGQKLEFLLQHGLTSLQEFLNCEMGVSCALPIVQ
ncbi:hypothetical protein SAMD00079811_78710 (plasmid) [Scytonema sp. HK-05]|uniref:hypothetical protein n=1 Tax=Scytonema sp. HK-05 TaxID=1137095 RepID=UPI000B61C80B|nr:hypothetical protein SAMD00079811_78710 [Scytonema sp. HK-05]